MSNVVRIVVILLVAYVLLVVGIIAVIHLSLDPVLPLQLIAPLLS